MVTKSTPACGPLGSWANRGPLVVCLASIVAIVGFLVINGAQIRETLEAENARVVAEDDRTFCTTFGIEPGTARYAECAAALRAVRSRHDQRRADFFF